MFDDEKETAINRPAELEKYKVSIKFRGEKVKVLIIWVVTRKHFLRYSNNGGKA
jgi:hypothetical protein